MKLFHIVPRYGKENNALKDYAEVLSIELRHFNIFSTFNAERKNIDAVFLHYSPYGFSKRGLCFSLLTEIQQYKNAGKKVFIFFHELYAPREKILSSGFWLSIIQKKIYQKLIIISDSIFCSSEIIQSQILSENKKVENKLYKVGLFSNIPTPESFPDWKKRKNTAVVFGTYGRRIEVYKKSAIINKLQSQLGVVSLIDIGEGDCSNLFQHFNVPVISYGRLPTNEIAGILQDSKFGFIHYPSHILGKSGIFAAYTGNGVCSINFDYRVFEAKDSIIPNINFISADSEVLSDANCGTIASEAFLWYRNNQDKSIHAEKIAKVITSII